MGEFVFGGFGVVFVVSQQEVELHARRKMSWASQKTRGNSIQNFILLEAK